MIAFVILATIVVACKADEVKTNCTSSQFECDGGKCISNSHVCDGVQDCVDFSDENENCTCKLDEFRCNDGKCISNSLVCDRVQDCDDFSDENENCTCKSDEFRCNDGTCIDNSLVCDGSPNCTDSSDENENCTCKSDEFRCNDGACIKNNFACDGFQDCKDSSDESKNCSCKPDQFRCNDGHCIPAVWECDGYEECLDGSDEGSQCPTQFPPPPPPPSSSSDDDDDGGSGCFPPNALAHTQGGLVQVKDIQLGTKVLAVDTNGTLVYSPVVAMIDASEDEVADYVVICTSSHRQIVLTTTHLIYKAENKNELMSKDISLQESSLVFASTVKEGDLIFEATPDGSLQPRRVLSITNKKIRGVYAPLTKEGTIIIDNFAASCYAFINDHYYAHLGFAPLRYLYDMLPSAFIGKQTDGIAWYPRLLQALGKIFLDENSFYPIQAGQDI